MDMSSQRVAAAFSRMQERAGLRSRVGDARCSSKCVPARHWERARPPTNRRAGALGAPPPHDGNRGSLEFEFRTKITRRSDVSADSNRRNHRGPVSCSVVLIDGVVSARRNRENRHVVRGSQWRDPDSNRRHHDFQTVLRNPGTRVRRPANKRVLQFWTTSRSAMCSQIAPGCTAD
jgi:hypothetical protein